MREEIKQAMPTSIKINMALKNKIKARAKAENRSVNNMIVRILEQEFKGNEV